MTRIQIIPGDFTLPANHPKFDFWVGEGVWTSDAFSEDGPLMGARTDTQMGGYPATWQAHDDGGWIKEAGQIRSTSTAVAGFKAGGADYTTSAEVAEMPTSSSSLVLSNRRATLAFSASLTAYVECRIISTGGINLVYREPNGAVITVGSAPTGAVQIGDTVALSTVGTTATVSVNGTEVITGTVPVTDAGYAAIRNTGGAAPGGFTSYKITVA